MTDQVIYEFLATGPEAFRVLTAGLQLDGEYLFRSLTFKALERRAEFGLLAALGARPSRIRRLILLEYGIVAVGGGRGRRRARSSVTPATPTSPSTCIAISKRPFIFMHCRNTGRSGNRWRRA